MTPLNKYSCMMISILRYTSSFQINFLLKWQVPNQISIEQLILMVGREGCQLPPKYIRFLVELRFLNRSRLTRSTQASHLSPIKSRGKLILPPSQNRWCGFVPKWIQWSCSPCSLDPRTIGLSGCYLGPPWYHANNQLTWNYQIENWSVIQILVLDEQVACVLRIGDTDLPNDEGTAFLCNMLVAPTFLTNFKFVVLWFESVFPLFLYTWLVFLVALLLAFEVVWSISQSIELVVFLKISMYFGQRCSANRTLMMVPH